MEHLFWFIIVISIVVFCHEFGHFYVARRCNVNVQKFSIGFGPVLFRYLDKKGTQWLISLIPLGGYVKLQGDDADPSISSEEISKLSKQEQESSFCCKSIVQKSAIVAAGPVANYVLSIFCFFLVFILSGMPSLDSKLDSVIEGSLAEKMGLKKGDVILEIDGHSISGGEDFKRIFIAGEEEVNLKISRDNNDFAMQFHFPHGKSERVLGVVFAVKIVPATISDAILMSLQHTYLMSKVILLGIKDMVSGNVGLEQLGGPIKIAEYSSKAAEKSFESLVWFVAMISLNLGLINLLPVPMLDGGRLVFYLIEGVTGRPLNKNFKTIATKIGFFILILLMITAISNDIMSLL